MSIFWQDLYKTAAELQGVSTVGLMDGDKMLMGKRRDNGKWTNPGGHLDPGEDPKAGARRELMEEAGVDLPLSAFKHILSEAVTTPKGKRLMIHAYRAEATDTKTSMKEDPDQEVHRWQWVKTPLSSEIMANLHSPKNVLLKGLGLNQEQKTACFWQSFTKRAESIGSRIGNPFGTPKPPEPPEPAPQTVATTGGQSIGQKIGFPGS